MASAKDSSAPKSLIKRLSDFLTLFWLLTESNAGTFVGPNTVFGICGALSGSLLVTKSGPIIDLALEALPRLPLVILFNWSNLIIFDLANQRLPESAREDALNKPWRPVPRGLITSDQIRHAMLYMIPAVIALNHFYLKVGVESLCIMILTWLYNDLRGGDQGFIERNAIIAVAFGIFNVGSVKVAIGTPFDITSTGVVWAVIVSAIIFTTMQVQDLQDQEGDRARGRRSTPLVLGDRAARWTVAVPTILWSCFVHWYWEAGLLAAAPQALLGLIVSVRSLNYSGLKEDKLTWRLWCFWTALLYMLPVACANYNTI
ncbi:UbiA prenyltransferase family-domain-containing protein [Hypoxylon trugodes]|uniref:UbiA prenyltransferase family-domain-containing protein n=1 Tax=Hypoxylon trugodes TaxID=326681 RepID=UPI00218D73FF|nr:UbiA prenyltransferase family-domain-containing protein [Hypoxylon trugodes]KAI1383024.1 UbiA prenyltransferase family-domain-containing protein [Hypoxylon trugodes]